jgi:hypothetical protein
MDLFEIAKNNAIREAGEYKNRHELPGGKADFDPYEKAQAAFEAGFHQGNSFRDSPELEPGLRAASISGSR